MGFHDKIAFKAKLDGENSALYRNAAQKHANATWVYLIIASIIWWKFSLICAALPFALAIFTAIQSISSTIVSMKLEKYEERNA